MYTVVLVDDEPLVLSRLSMGFEWEETEFSVIAGFTDSREALKQLGKLKPDVVFTDIRMPHFSGLDLIREWKKQSPETYFVIISGYEDFEYIREAMILGAIGYCVKPLSDEDIMEVLNKIMSRLSQSQHYFEMLLDHALDWGEEKSFSIFLNEILDQYALKLPFYVSAIRESSLSQVEEAASVVLNYKGIVEFQFWQSDELLRDVTFQQRLAKKIREKKMGGFAWGIISNVSESYPMMQGLLEKIYMDFLGMEALRVCGPIQIEEKSKKSSYIILLEKYYGEHKNIDFLEHIKEHEKRYERKHRSMEEALQIYNMAMSFIFWSEGSYFHHPAKSLYDLIVKFASFDCMMEELKTILQKKICHMQIPDLNMIRSEVCRKILLFLQSNYTESISFQEICRNFSISPSYLSQIFQKELGMTFTEYLTLIRIEYAKELLRITTIPISEVGERSGYEDFSYFSKIFKKKTGSSPSRYRESHQSNRKLSGNDMRVENEKICESIDDHSELFHFDLRMQSKNCPKE